MLKGPFSTKKTITRNKKNMKEKNLSGKGKPKANFHPLWFTHHLCFIRNALDGIGEKGALSTAYTLGDIGRSDGECGSVESLLLKGTTGHRGESALLLLFFF